MKKLYIFQDKVSRQFGPVTETDNINVLKRDFQRMVDNPSVPDYVLRDTVIYELGEVHYTENGPVIKPSIPQIVLRGDDFNYDCTSETSI